jgi:hypothetical protein
LHDFGAEGRGFYIRPYMYNYINYTMYNIEALENDNEVLEKVPENP